MYAVVTRIHQSHTGCANQVSSMNLNKEGARQRAASLLYSFVPFMLVLLLSINTHNAYAGLNASIEWGLEYDSNVLSNNQLNNDYDSDFSNRLGIAIGGDYRWPGVLRLQGQYQYSQTRWLEASQYDTDIHTSFLRISDRKGEWIREGILLHAQAKIEGQDFLILNRISPALSYFPSRQWYLRTQLDIGEKKFPQYSNRDAIYLGIKPSVYWLINNMQHYLKLQFNAKQENVCDNQYDYQSYGASASWNIKFSDIKVTLETELEEKQYATLWPSIAEQREDTRYKSKIKIQQNVSSDFIVTTEVGYDKNESNLASSNYDQVRGLLKIKYEW